MRFDKEYNTLWGDSATQRLDFLRECDYTVIMNKTAKKAFSIVGIVIAGIVGLLLLVYAALGLTGAVMYREARKVREVAFTIPAIHSGFVPQGVDTLEDGTVLTTGYDAKTDETLLYIGAGKSFVRVPLADEEGKPLIGHGGGVTHAGDVVYVAVEDSLAMFSLSALKNANGERVQTTGSISLPCRAAFCFSDGESLYVGEFYRKGNYETPASHRTQTPCGDLSPALVVRYRLLGDLPVTPFPQDAYSIPSLVQGFAKKDDVFMLSRSYGLKNSRLEYYASPAAAGKITLQIGEMSADVPLFALESACKFRTLTLPAFSEDLAVHGDRVIVNQESACNKYIIGKLFFATNPYSSPILPPAYKKRPHFCLTRPPVFAIL